MAFVHLHNHTVFSMLDGATRIQDMVNRAVELGMACRGHYRPRLHVWRARPGAGLRRRQPQHARVQNLEPRQGLPGKGPPRRVGGARSRGKPARACPVCEGHGHVGREGQHRRAQAAPGHQAHLWLRGLLYAGRDPCPRPQARALPHDPPGQGSGGATST